MRVGDTLSRRKILAAIGTGTAGTIPTVQADNHNRSDNFPDVRQGQGFEITRHDCARVTVDAVEPSTEMLEIIVMYMVGESQAETEMFYVDQPDYPYEFVANCHLDRLDNSHGSATVSMISIWDGDRMLLQSTQPEDNEHCGDVIEQEVDPYVFENFCD
ncbi:hypothetical protein [Natronorubrum sp. A-ect3]|uniref:hypothetical protein n=1 Tax=Natronorubrum sp. A-ect3 TaxID=3242698 RepID=UPI00359DDBBF